VDEPSPTIRPAGTSGERSSAASGRLGEPLGGTRGGPGRVEPPGAPGGPEEAGVGPGEQGEAPQGGPLLRSAAAAQGGGDGDDGGDGPGVVVGADAASADRLAGAAAGAVAGRGRPGLGGGGGVLRSLGSPPARDAGGAELLAAGAQVDVFRAASRSANTLAAYRSDWARFTAWCEAQGVTALPAEPTTVAAYLAAAATETSATGRSAPWRYAPASLARFVATINAAHDLAGVRPPGRDRAVAETLAGIRRTRATPPVRKAPILLADLETIVAGIGSTGWPAAPGGLRNRALLVLGWVGAFRRSELAGLALADVTTHPEDGLHVRLRQSKTDPEAAGQVFALPYARQSLLCAPCAWARWRAVADAWDGTDGGPARRAGVMRACRHLDLDRHVCRDSPPRPATARHEPGDGNRPAFRAVRANGTLGGPITGAVINQVIKTAAAAAGFDPDRVGGHSLRAGFVTQAFRTGADAHAIMRQTRHRDPKTLEIYAREGAPLIGNAVTKVGL